MSCMFSEKYYHRRKRDIEARIGKVVGKITDVIEKILQDAMQKCSYFCTLKMFRVDFSKSYILDLYMDPKIME